MAMRMRAGLPSAMRLPDGTGGGMMPGGPSEPRLGLVNRRTVRWCLICDAPDCGNIGHDQVGGVWFCDLCTAGSPCDECRGRNS